MAMDSEQAERSGLVDRWQTRQEALAERLELWGVRDAHREIDWQNGRIGWSNAEGEELAHATMVALCSYALDEKTLLMSWANPTDRPAATLEPVPEVPEVIENCTEAEAWMWAMHLAEAAQSDYLYRVASPGYLVFLGLWKVSSPLDDRALAPESAAVFVLRMLDELRGAVADEKVSAIALRQKLLNQADSFRVNKEQLLNQGADPVLLHRTADELHDLGQTMGQRRFGLFPPAVLAPAQREQVRSRLLGLRRAWSRQGARRRHSDRHG